jgi:hypothetical protein
VRLGDAQHASIAFQDSRVQQTRAFVAHALEDVEAESGDEAAEVDAFAQSQSETYVVKDAHL